MKLNIDWHIDDITTGKIIYILVFIFLSRCKEENKEKLQKGRAITQAVGLWLPTAATRIQTRV
jgi:hypothetical protein